jgi:hypothetical protein
MRFWLQRFGVSPIDVASDAKLKALFRSIEKLIAKMFDGLRFRKSATVE